MADASMDTGDFLMDPGFVRWVKHGENDLFWQRFLAANPSRKEAAEQARLVILAATKLPVTPLSEERREIMWEHVQQQIASERRPLFAAGRIRKAVWMSLAASVAVLLLWAGWQWSKPGNTGAVSYEQLVRNAGEPGNSWVEKSNPYNEVLPVELPDGSAVLLKANSRISYAAHGFGTTAREVYLSGEAFFEVKKDPSVPFYVYANELVTRVLGTSFTVTAFPDGKEVGVSVKTGKVSVYTRTEKLPGEDADRKIVLPNERVTLDRQALRLSLMKIPPAATQPEEVTVPGEFLFDDVPVSQVFDKIQHAYGVAIDYDLQLLKDCRIRAPLTDEPLYEKIRLICQGLNATYEVVDTRIVIHAPGCN